MIDIGLVRLYYLKNDRYRSSVTYPFTTFRLDRTRMDISIGFQSMESVPISEPKFYSAFRTYRSTHYLGVF